MKWYKVTKKIRGKAYLYRQRSWREGGKVRTQCQSLGPVDEGRVPLTQEQIDALPEPGSLKINWPGGPEDTKGQKKRNTTKKTTFEHLIVHKDLGAYKVSAQALEREYHSVIRNAQQLGLDVSRFPSISIETGKKVGWRKAWFGKRRYVVTLQQGHRTQFKQAYREALSQAFLEELKRQNRPTYKAMIKHAPHGVKRAVWARETLCEVMQRGLEPSSKQFRRDVRRKGIPEQFSALGKYRLCEALKERGVSW